MNATTKLTRRDAAQILATTYPEYKGRKIRLVVRASYTMSNYWSEGSRCYVVAVRLADGAAALPKPASQIPWNDEANATVQIPAGVALVEHSIFCGKDAGITIYVNPADAERTLPAVTLAA